MNTDRIYIRDLGVECIIGDQPRERTKPQRVVLNIALECDLERAGATDSLADTLDYAAVADEIARVVQRSSCQLIERLAQLVADACLGFPGVAGVTVTIEKPGAIPGARAAAVEIQRPARGRAG